VVVRYYAQHQLEALDCDRTVLQELEAVADPSSGHDYAASRAFPFTGRTSTRRWRCCPEERRLARARAAPDPPCHLLPLTSPRTTSDPRSREVLEEALNEYEGTLVVTPTIATSSTAWLRRSARSAEGREIYPGDYDSYPSDGGTASPDPPKRARTAAAPAEREARRTEAEERNRRYRPQGGGTVRADRERDQKSRLVP
jgi:hypothetical protein